MLEFKDFAGLLREEVRKVAFESYDQQPSVIPQVMEVVPFSQAPQDKMYWVESRAVRDTQTQERRPGEEIKESTAREARRIPYAWKYHAEKIKIPDEMVAYVQGAQDGMVSDNAADSVLEYIRPQARWFGKERARREEELAASFFNNAGLTAGHAALNQTIEVFEDAKGDLAYDGKPLVALSGNNHPAIDGSTYFNGLALNLTTTNLDTALQRMESSNAFDEMGRTIHVRAGQLIVPPALKQTAIQIVAARALAGTGNNDANPYADLDLIVWNHLTDTDAWFLQDPTLKALKWYDGGPPMVKVGEKVENFSSVIAVQFKYACNVDEWRGFLGSNCSSA